MRAGAQQALRHHLRKTRHDYLLQAAIFQEALDCLSGPGGCATLIFGKDLLHNFSPAPRSSNNSTRFVGENDRPLGDDPKKPSHAPLLTRQTERESRLSDCSYVKGSFTLQPSYYGELVLVSF